MRHCCESVLSGEEGRSAALAVQLQETTVPLSCDVMWKVRDLPPGEGRLRAFQTNRDNMISVLNLVTYFHFGSSHTRSSNFQPRLL